MIPDSLKKKRITDKAIKKIYRTTKNSANNILRKLKKQKFAQARNSRLGNANASVRASLVLSVFDATD